MLTISYLKKNFFWWLQILGDPFPLRERLFCLGRFLTAPFLQMEALLPKTGKFLDIGCGHGLFMQILKISAPQRYVCGIDPDKQKIVFAQQLKQHFSYQAFHVESGFLEQHQQNAVYDVCVLNDVDYLLPSREKKRLFLAIKKTLKNDGQFLLKTVVNDKSIGFYLGYIQEIIVVHFLKKTLSDQNKFFFFSIEQYRKLLAACGFQIIKEKSLDSFSLHPHYVFLVRKD